MKIYVDADSCPQAAREIVLRAASRLGIAAVFAANRPIPGVSDRAEMLVCPAGDGAADNRIASLAAAGDLAVTRDIPLAARLVAAGVAVLDDRGRIYTADNTGERLSLRNFTVSLAENGLEFTRIKSYGKREVKAFAGSLDRLLVQLMRKTRT
ncbi:MAG: DUF188 domain-containing protein [Treponema sp.]|jgi:uncharacterized protein YaiI (UPF0178 family)|nr:DUF188 domain-containing protein [Treponema sp.]